MLRAPLFAIALLGVTSCATIINDSGQIINVSASNGKPVEGTINGIPFKGPVPVTVQRAKAALDIKSTTEGCAPVTTVKSETSGVFWLNIILGGFFGSTTDYASGDMWKYDQNVIISCDL
ncbi:adenosine deaminase [Nevskia ramosa]|uniref:adenosine deaminase n=2 Tax=Nevskia TaxID=64001 RepID=UPI003D12DE95